MESEVFITESITRVLIHQSKVNKVIEELNHHMNNL